MEAPHRWSSPFLGSKSKNIVEFVKAKFIGVDDFYGQGVTISHWTATLMIFNVVLHNVSACTIL
jgi:hypothetical protein